MRKGPSCPRDYNIEALADQIHYDINSIINIVYPAELHIKRYQDRPMTMAADMIHCDVTDINDQLYEDHNPRMDHVVSWAERIIANAKMIIEQAKQGRSFAVPEIEIEGEDERQD